MKSKEIQIECNRVLIRMELLEIQKSLRKIIEAKQNLPIDNEYGKIINSKNFAKLHSTVSDLYDSLRPKTFEIDSLIITNY